MIACSVFYAAGPAISAQGNEDFEARGNALAQLAEERFTSEGGDEEAFVEVTGQMPVALPMAAVMEEPGQPRFLTDVSDDQIEDLRDDCEDMSDYALDAVAAAD